MKPISHKEVADVLLAVADGRATATSLGDINWRDLHEPQIDVDGWKITLFIEASWIYDVYDVRAPDGRAAAFTPRDKDSDINLFLSDWHVAKLVKALGGPFTDDDVDRFRPDS